MVRKILEPVVDDKIVHKSSITQYADNCLSVYERGEYKPIEFDMLDYIRCGRPVSHKAIIKYNKDIGYEFPVGECVVTNNTYIYFDQQGTVLKEMPKWMGEGFIEAYEKSQSFINLDGGAVGTQARVARRVGLDYVVTDTLIQGEK